MAEKLKKNASMSLEYARNSEQQMRTNFNIENFAIYWLVIQYFVSIESCTQGERF